MMFLGQFTRQSQAMLRNRRAFAAARLFCVNGMGCSPHIIPIKFNRDCCARENRRRKLPTTKIMKHLMPVLLAAAVLAGCDKQKAAIETNKEATKNAIDDQKKAVDAAAVEAKKQTDAQAAIDKAAIDAKQAATQAQLDADKKKADAEAAFQKAKVDAEKK
jgi:hypothetical protein